MKVGSLKVSWSDVKLGVLMLDRGESINPANHPDELFDLYSIPAFDSRQPEVLPGREIGSTKQIVESDDVLLSKIVPHIRRAWTVGQSSDRRMIASSEWIVFRSSHILPDYLRNLLVTDQFHAELMSTVSGVGGSLLRARPAYVAKISVPIPPLPEQRRIANILDKADALRAKRRVALAQLDELAQSIFLEMFGDPVTNPKRFDVVKSSEIFSDKPRIGTIKPASGSGFLLVRVGEIGDDEIRFGDCDRVELADVAFDKFALQEGDTVIARAIGSLAHLGKSSYFAGHNEPVVIDSHVMRLRPDTRVCHPRWFYELVSLPRGKVLLQKQGGATAIQFNINGTQASNLEIPLPPLALQRRFVDVVHSVYGQRDILRSHLTTLDDLFASLQQRAFRGEL